MNKIELRAFEPIGLTQAAAEAVAKEIAGKVKAMTPAIEVQVVRFVPSTLIAIPNGFQVVANTTIQLPNAGRRNFDSVATIETTGAKMKLTDIKLPAFSVNSLS